MRGNDQSKLTFGTHPYRRVGARLSGHWPTAQQPRFVLIESRPCRIFMHYQPWADCPLLPLWCRAEVSAGEIFGEPDDQVVVHGHQHPLAQRPLALACAPAVRYIAAPPGAADSFGEIALLRRISRTATVTAISRLRARILDREEFLAAVTGSPQSVESADAVISARLQAG